MTGPGWVGARGKQCFGQGEFPMARVQNKAPWNVNKGRREGQDWNAGQMWPLPWCNIRGRRAVAHNVCGPRPVGVLQCFIEDSYYVKIKVWELMSLVILFLVIVLSWLSLSLSLSLSSSFSIQFNSIQKSFIGMRNKHLHCQSNKEDKIWSAIYKIYISDITIRLIYSIYKILNIEILNI